MNDDCKAMLCEKLPKYECHSLIPLPEFNSEWLEWEVRWELDCYCTVLHTCVERLFCGKETNFSYREICGPREGRWKRFTVVWCVDGVISFSVFRGCEPKMIAFVIVGSSCGVVDCCPVLFEPYTDGVKTCNSFGLNQAFGRWTYTKNEIATFCHDFCETADDTCGGFPSRTRHPSPIISQRNATLPRIIELCLGNCLLWCLIVFVRTMRMPG